MIQYRTVGIRTVLVIVVIVIVLLIVVILGHLKALSIVKRNAVLLSAATGILADQIQREIVRGKLTPGDWALAHGLDPMIFQRRS